MPIFFKKEKLQMKLFIVGSFAAFIIFAALLIFLRSSDIANISYGSDRYYINKEANNNVSDPMVTRVPSLKDVLAGPIISDLDPNIGPADTLVNIVIFSDSDCKFCAEQEKIIRNLMASYPEKIRLIRKDFPDTKKTSISWQKAMAGRCAFEQGKFWPFHDLILNAQGVLGEEQFIQIAKSLKLDEKTFRSCLVEERPSAQIIDNITEANTLEITGVPDIFVNDKEFSGQVSLEELRQVVESRLKK
jgi:protein-disulfide isomerase